MLLAVPCWLIISPRYFSETEFPTVCSPMRMGFSFASFRSFSLASSGPIMTYFNLDEFAWSCFDSNSLPMSFAQQAPGCREIVGDSWNGSLAQAIGLYTAV